jgi:putative oxidoreductase
MKIRFTLGRLLYGGFFLASGISHFREYKRHASYAESKGVPHLLAPAAVVGTGALLVAGGASLLLGVRPKLGSAAVIAFLAGVSPVMHNFWKQQGEMRENEMAHLMKNAALLGGALALAGVEEPWPFSLPLPAGIKAMTQPKAAVPRAA